jgi:hypothetical protein
MSLPEVARRSSQAHLGAAECFGKSQETGVSWCSSTHKHVLEEVRAWSKTIDIQFGLPVSGSS